MNYLFPLTYLANGLATTFLLLGLGLAGESLLAADVGLVQGATLATFYAFSGNARNLILHSAGARHLPGILSARLILALPLSAIALLLCVAVGGVSPWLALALVLRRCGESFSEVHLSLLEREDRAPAALRFLSVQAVSLLLALVWAVAQWEGWLLVWFAWALFPAISAVPDLRQVEWLDRKRLRQVLPELFPHLGSTAIIGISIYAFRLLVLLLGGKSLAGDLYTAFALGSFAGSVFANVLGPSLVWHHARTGERHGGWLERLVLPGLLALGAGILVLAWTAHTGSLLGRSLLFWEAVGWSLAGGAAMLTAQRLRLALLQESSGVSVFGADMMINFLLLASTPFFFTLLGLRGLVGLYALNALLCLVFYASAQGFYQTVLRRVELSAAALLTLLSGLVLTPLFVQLSRGFYHRAEALIDSGGDLLSVPLPLSFVFAVSGILILGRFRRAQAGLSLLFVLFLGMLLATVISTHGELSAEKGKLLLLLQFLVPVLGLVLGQMMGAASWQPIAAGFLVCLWVFLPWQIGASWLQGELLLSHDLGVVSVYQHRQYVPTMLVAAYLTALYTLTRSSPWRMAALALSPLVAIYAVASTSILAQMGLLAGGLLYLRLYPSDRVIRRGAAAIVMLGLGYLLLAFQSAEFSAKFAYVDQARAGVLPDSFQARIAVWAQYFASIAGDLTTIAFGHARPPARWQSTGAHNYYLDFVYHFGIFALLPLLFLVWYTAQRLWRVRDRLARTPELIGLAAIVGFLLFADNNWKVALRQPYSGMLSFFLWGLLLARIQRLREGQRQPVPLTSARVSHAH